MVSVYQIRYVWPSLFMAASAGLPVLVISSNEEFVEFVNLAALLVWYPPHAPCA